MTKKELLIDLLSVQTTSGNEFNMIAHIFNFCRQNVPEADVKVKDNNIYITKMLNIFMITLKYLMMTAAYLHLMQRQEHR